MKVILYMAITANGLIAKEDDDTSWISTEEWSTYSKLARKIGNIIVGKRTYDIFTKQIEFQELKDTKFVVVTHHNFKTLSNHHFIAKSPKDALKFFKNDDELIVAGGGILNGAFMKENLVDEIYIDIEPIVFGKGIPVFASSDFQTKLELIETKMLSKNTIQLHYRVKK